MLHDNARISKLPFISFSKKWIVVTEVCDLTARMIGHPVKYSTANRTYLFPRCVMSNGPEKSIEKI